MTEHDLKRDMQSLPREDVDDTLIKMIRMRLDHDHSTAFRKRLFEFIEDSRRRLAEAERHRAHYDKDLHDGEIW